MSRQRSVFLAIGIVCAALHAAPAAGQVTGGVKGGLAFSGFRFTGDDPEAVALKARPDFVFGGFIGAPVGRKVSAEAEVMFSRRGARLDAGPDRTQFELSYLDISGLARGALWHSPSATVVAFGGLTTGFKIAAKEVMTRGASETTSVDVGEIFDNLDVRLLMGAGVELRHLLVEWRYSHGLRAIVVNPFASDVAKTFTNRAFEIMVGVRF